jgi:hypothetical protein
MNVYELKELLQQDDVLMLKDASGQLHEIIETTDLSKLDKPEFVKVSAKNEIYGKVFGKQRISLPDFQTLLDVYNELIDYVIDYSAPANKKKFKEMAGR